MKRVIKTFIVIYPQLWDVSGRKAAPDGAPAVLPGRTLLWTLNDLLQRTALLVQPLVLPVAPPPAATAAGPRAAATAGAAAGSGSHNSGAAAADAVGEGFALLDVPLPLGGDGDVPATLEGDEFCVQHVPFVNSAVPCPVYTIV